MTDDKIEAAAREQLEELAREVACEKVGQCFTQGTDVLIVARAVKAAKYAYLAGHASRDEEVKALQDEVDDWRESARKAADETCGPMDGVHCTCVAVLRHEVAALRARLAAMREPLWVLREEHESEVADLRARLEAAENRNSKWRSAFERARDMVLYERGPLEGESPGSDFINAVLGIFDDEFSEVVPPVPLPETKP